MRCAPARIAVLGLLGLACGPAGEAPPPEPLCAPLERRGPPVARDVVLILSDTLRRDRIAPYGGPAATPSLAAFARDAVVFTAAVAPAPWTKPSIATLFTGLAPSAHGVTSHPRLRARKGAPVMESDVLHDALPTLAETLSLAGYRTAAFVSNPWLQPEFGFAQGFDVYEDGFADNTTPGEVVTQAGLAWLRARPDDGRPVFLYLHYMDAHAPYHPVPPAVLRANVQRIERDERAVGAGLGKAIARRAIDPAGRPLVAQGVPANLALMELVYDQGVAHFDRALGAFLDVFDDLPGAESAAVLVTSDHGEALFERGWGSHGHGLYEDETAIPLLARMPGVTRPAVVDCPTGLVDVRETLCDYLGVRCPEPAGQGVSFFSRDFADPERVVSSESVIDRPRNRALRERRHKLLLEPDGRRAGPAVSDGQALFDLAADPRERRNLLRGGGSDAALEALVRLRSADAARPTEPLRPAPRRALDDATRERLEALGYLEGD